MSISSFKPLLIVLLFFSCRTNWYQTLPEKSETRDIQISGTWKKTPRHNNPLNSVEFRDEINESIEFNATSKTFSKTSLSRFYLNGKNTETLLKGTGDYQIRGNWIILNTRYINQISPVRKIKKSRNSMLYHYYKNTLIPMADDSFFRDNNFGIKDLIKTPYKEDDLFFRARNIYIHKTNIPHVYYPVNN